MRKEWRYEVKYLLEKSFFVVTLPSQLWWAAECVRNRKHLPNVEAAFALDEAKGTLHAPHFAKERPWFNYSWIIKFRAYIPYKSDNTIIFMLVCGGEGVWRVNYISDYISWRCVSSGSKARAYSLILCCGSSLYSSIYSEYFAPFLWRLSWTPVYVILWTELYCCSPQFFYRELRWAVFLMIQRTNSLTYA